jgi:probable HAF family extracellular repeat protein
MSRSSEPPPDREGFRRQDGRYPTRSSINPTPHTHEAIMHPVTACLTRLSLMRPPGLSALLLLSLASCQEPTNLSNPSLEASSEVRALSAAGFRVRTLGPFGGSVSEALDINERVDVVGVDCCPESRVRAFLWRRGRSLPDLGSLGGERTTATSINDRREVVGYSELSPGTLVFRAFLWRRSSGIVDLGTLGGATSFALGINNRREIVGSSETATGELPAFFWRPGRRMRSLGTLGGFFAEALDINDASKVVGYSETSDGNVHAFLWSPGRGMEDLGTLGGAFSIATGISQTGEVVGSSETATGTTEAFIWTRRRGMRSLGHLGGGFAEATDINTHRRVVGHGIPAEGFTTPFLWTPHKGMRALPIPDGALGSGFASALNEFGHIVGRTGNEATLWVPSAGPLAASEPAEVTPLRSSPGAARNPGGGRAEWCAMRRQLNDRLRTPLVVSKVCRES